MVLIIETTNVEVIHAFSELAKALNVEFKVEPGDAVVSREERQRRLKTLRAFKGGLKKYSTGYQPDKYEWYQQ